MARRSKKVEEAKEAPAPEVDNVTEKEELETETSNETTADELDDIEKIEQVSGSNCGGALLAARQEKGLSIKEVAEQLRLGSKQIEALEADDFAALPEPTIVKGFIRNYAKFLNITAEPLLMAYAETAPEKEHYAFALDPGINMKITEGGRPKKSKYILMAVLLLLGLGVWFFYQNYIQKPSSSAPMPETMDTLPELELPMSESMESLPATQLDMPEPATEEEKVEETNSAAEKPTEMQQASQIAETDVVTEESAATDEAKPEPEVTPEPAVGKTRIVFEVSQETWLSVVNTSGTEVYNKILYPGDRDMVDVRRPSEIVVGNAHGATLTVNGKSIDLAPYTRINVARVRLNR